MRYAPITVEQVRAAIDHGCGDNSCRFVKPRGMGTNGGCSCFDKRPSHVLSVDLLFLILDLTEGA